MAERTNMYKTTSEERKESIEILTKLFQKDPRVFIVQTHVSKSGMQRRLRLYHINTNEEHPTLDITYHVSNVLGWSMDGRGLKVDGCGMDMHFHTLYVLGCDLWGFSSEPNQGGYRLKAISL